MKGIVDFMFGNSRRLNAIIRFNTRIRTYNEPVSAHSFYVSVYTFLIAHLLYRDGVEIDIDLAVLKAIFHDLEEAVAGDILTPFKKQFKKEYMDLCNCSFDDVTKGLDSQLKESVRGYWSRAKEGLEGEVVDFCDDLAGAIYCLEQIRSGNKYFKDIFDDYLGRLQSKKTYKVFIEIAEEIKRKYTEIQK